MNYIRFYLLGIVLLSQLQATILQTNEDFGKSHKSSVTVSNGIAFLTIGKIRFEKREVKLRRVVDFSALYQDLQLLAEAIEILNEACVKSLSPTYKVKQGIKATLDLWESPIYGWSTQEKQRLAFARKTLFDAQLPLQLNCATFVEKWQNRQTNIERKIARAVLPLEGDYPLEDEELPYPERTRRALPLIVVSAFLNVYNQYKLRKVAKDNSYAIDRLRVKAADHDQIINKLENQVKALDLLVKDQESLRQIMAAEIASLYEKTDRMTIFLASQGQLLNLFNRFEEYLQRIELDLIHKIEALQIVVFAAASHHTSRLVFSPAIYKSLKAELQQFTFLKPISELTSDVDQVTHQSFRLTTTIPVYEKEDFFLYRIFAIPDLTHGFVPEIPNPLVAMRDRGSTFIPLTELQLSLCQKNGCRAPAKETATTFAPCGVAQIVGQAITNCAWRPYADKHYITKYPQGLVFRFKTNATATVQCAEGLLTDFVLQDAGVLELPPGCKATIHYQGLQSHIDGPNQIMEARQWHRHVTLLNSTRTRVAKVVTLRGLAKYHEPWKLRHILTLIT